MTVKKIIAIVFIFILAGAGWGILGTATTYRTGNFEKSNRQKVDNLCGGILTQECPCFTITSGREHLNPVANIIKIKLMLEQRRKGLMWFPVFMSVFDGSYTIKNSRNNKVEVSVHFQFPSSKATYDDFAVEIDKKPFITDVNTAKGIVTTITLEPGQKKVFRVFYKTRGVGSWRYRPQSGSNNRIQGLDMEVITDFKNIDFPEGTISPRSLVAASDSCRMTWKANNLITSDAIGIKMPRKLNPGPLVSRITFFAPVCLLFFFVIMMTIAVICKISIHPMHYLFVAAGFFAFHLLFAYLVDVINVHLAFIISSATTLVLVNSYMRGTLGVRFPWFMAGAAQFFYLVLFSYSFFFKGLTGLTVTIGSIITLAILMYLTRGIDWDKVFNPHKADNILPPEKLEPTMALGADDKIQSHGGK